MEKAYKKVLALDSSGLVASVAVVERQQPSGRIYN